MIKRFDEEKRCKTDSAQKGITRFGGVQGDLTERVSGLHRIRMNRLSPTDFLTEKYGVFRT
jgi:hypothetical protein